MTNNYTVLWIEEIGNLIGIESFIFNLEDLLMTCNCNSEEYHSFDTIIRLFSRIPVGIDYMQSPFKSVDIPDVGKMVSIQDAKDYIRAMMHPLSDESVSWKTYDRIFNMLETISAAYDADIELDFD